VTDLNFSQLSINSGVRYYSASNSITSATPFRKDLGTSIHYSAGNEITLTTDFEAGGESYFHGKIGPCPGIAEDPFLSPFEPHGKLVMDAKQENISNQPH
jgi:hypothetical protein